MTPIQQWLFLLSCVAVSSPAVAQAPLPGPPLTPGTLLLRPARVFDGTTATLHPGWVVLVVDGRIATVGPESGIRLPTGGRRIELPGTTLMPGLIEAHSHLLLHPYNETSWDDQVLRESEAYRVARATTHAEASLQAGITTMRDLGSEGAGYADVGLRRAISNGIIPGPRLQVAGRAIVATGSYGPSGFDPSFDVPLGAEPADGTDLVRVVRDQIGKGADWVKVYADYRWGPSGEARPTFSLDELRLVVETAVSSGRPVVAHAATAEGMRRAILAGVASIEHGDGGTEEVFRLMAERKVVLCPTIAAGDAISQYRGWRKGTDPEPERIGTKRSSMRRALAAGVPLCFGGDVGVYPHGDNVREIELMVEYGVPPLDALRAATSGNAALLRLADQIGRVGVGMVADLIAVDGNPLDDLSALRRIRIVIQGGQVVRLEDGRP